MSEDPAEHPSDRTTAADRVPIRDELPPRAEVVRDISLNRRQSRTIAPPRKWRKIGLRQIVCPECRSIVGGISDGFWHLQTAHNQGQGVDLEAWGMELRAELDEYIGAAKGRRGLVAEHSAWSIGLQSWVLLAAIVILLVAGLIYAMNSTG